MSGPRAIGGQTKEETPAGAGRGTAKWTGSVSRAPGADGGVIVEPQAAQQVAQPRPAGVHPDDLAVAAAAWAVQDVEGEDA